MSHDVTARRASIGHAIAAVAIALAMPAAHARAQRVRLPDPLTLEHALQMAEMHRREVDAAEALAVAASERPAIVSAPDDPMIAASVDHFPVEQIMGVDWTIMVQQTFPLGDVLGSRARGAHAEARRLSRDADRVALDVQAEAAMAFLELYLARALDGILAEQIAVTEQLVAASQARYAAGLGAQTDALRAEAELARLRAERAALAGTIEGAEGMLAAALGLPSRTSMPTLAVPADGRVPTTRFAVARALRQRPEVDAMREAIARSEAQVSEMEAMYFPMITIGVGGAYTMAEGAGVMGVVGFTIPIFRDRLDSGVDEARAMVSMSQAELGAMERMVEGQVASARGQVLAARARRDALVDDVLPRTRQAVDAGLAQYGAGQVPQVTVIESLRALFEIRTDALRAEVEAAMAGVRLRRALGRMR